MSAKKSSIEVLPVLLDECFSKDRTTQLQALECLATVVAYEAETRKMFIKKGYFERLVQLLYKSLHDDELCRDLLKIFDHSAHTQEAAKIMAINEDIYGALIEILEDHNTTLSGLILEILHKAVAAHAKYATSLEECRKLVKLLFRTLGEQVADHSYGMCRRAETMTYLTKILSINPAIATQIAVEDNALEQIAGMTGMERPNVHGDEVKNIVLKWASATDSTKLSNATIQEQAFRFLALCIHNGAGPNLLKHADHILSKIVEAVTEMKCPARPSAYWLFFRLIRAAGDQYSTVILHKTEPVRQMCESFSHCCVGDGRVEAAMALSAIIRFGPKVPNVEVMKTILTAQYIQSLSNAFGQVGEDECVAVMQEMMPMIAAGHPVVQFLSRLIQAFKLFVKWETLYFIQDRSHRPIDLKPYSRGFQIAYKWCDRNQMSSKSFDLRRDSGNLEMQKKVLFEKSKSTEMQGYSDDCDGTCGLGVADIRKELGVLITKHFKEQPGVINDTMSVSPKQEEPDYSAKFIMMKSKKNIQVNAEARRRQEIVSRWQEAKDGVLDR
eukprot:Selendium_serpulae@DN6462_c0_g1_i10.p1